VSSDPASPSWFQSQFGEAFVGAGPNAAHLNTVLGARGGPVEVAWATSLATPTVGHQRFVTVARPGVPVKPLTLFVPKAEVRPGSHETMTWGAAQAGVAGGVVDAVTAGVVDAASTDRLLLIAAVWVDPTADDADEVYANNRAATLGALEAGSAHRPSLDDVLAAGVDPHNPFYGGRAPTA
jgi:5,6,7,8-tetrahydromethanopterin hydro-lyase